MIIIIIWNAAVLLHALGSTVAFSVLKEPVGNLLQVFFVNFLTFSLYLWRETTYRVFATNSLSMVYVFVLTSVQVRRIIYIYIYIYIYILRLGKKIEQKIKLPLCSLEEQRNHIDLYICQYYQFFLIFNFILLKDCYMIKISWVRVLHHEVL
jgi:hypothetical protein